MTTKRRYKALTRHSLRTYFLRSVTYAATIVPVAAISLWWLGPERVVDALRGERTLTTLEVTMLAVAMLAAAAAAAFLTRRPHNLSQPFNVTRQQALFMERLPDEAVTNWLQPKLTREFAHDPHTAQAAAEVAAGLDNLFRRLGPPPPEHRVPSASPGRGGGGSQQ